MSFVIIILSVIIVTCSIPILFKLKNYMYKKQDLEIKKSEETYFLLGGFTLFFILGIFFKHIFMLIMSLPFIYWLLVDIINFDIKLWKQFLRLK